MKLTLNASSRMLPRLAPALLCLAMAGSGCSQQKMPAQQQEADKQALVADSLYMARLYAGWEQQVESQGLRRGGRASHMEIDLSDDTQYRFVTNRLQAAGSTPKNSPQLFRKLEKLRKDKKSGTPRIHTREDRLASAAAEEGAENTWCGHLLPLTDVANSDKTVAKFQASGLVTCFDGSDYAFANVTAFATNRERTQFRVLGAESLEEYAGVVLETPPLDINVAVNPDEELFVDSLAVAFDEETGESHLSYAVAESSLLAVDDVNTIGFLHPKELIGRHLPDNPIRTCLERGSVAGFLDCDYTSGSKDPATGAFRPFAAPFTGVAAVDAEASRTLWVPAKNAYWEPSNGSYDISRLYLPMRGTYQVTLPSDCTLNALTSDATIVLLERGGRCSAGTAPGTSVLKGSIPFKTPFLDDYNRTLLNVPFDGLVDFGKDCLAVYQNVRLMTRATMRATCVDYRTGNTRTLTRSRFENIENLDWRNACLAEGTRVTKADGSQVPVEQVKVGDKLLANGKGLALTVTTVSRGAESKPIVKLRDALGGEVMVTQTHPMLTASRGVVQAGELKVGDALLTRTGSAKLVGVERVPYAGQVFNFALGTKEELAQAPAEARTLYANGYLVGDSQMQSTLEKQRTQDSREVLTRLNGAWHEDFRRHQERNTSARR
ncbi:Hint domain-containing protein [Archangium lansingense]|uniref:Hint domain-containing protein n=1 Tax=Archangium lansingense TaxID=2995310 RepID=A0ABT4ANA2_9BACT|nr:Hint domain-containing protein [Archangium lansinium]MCY1082654.1 Hint domain-containing protein [Archangium lansinium]